MIFDELGKIYNEIDAIYLQAEAKARAKGFRKKEAEYSRRRELNDHAYFLFMFTRLEDRIREISNNLIDKKNTNLRDWKVRRI